MHLQKEGLQAVIDRACACVEAGADANFAEAMTDITDVQNCLRCCGCACIGKYYRVGDTPYYTKEDLGEQGISMVLYPLSPTRAMQKAALEVMHAIRNDGYTSGCTR